MSKKKIALFTLIFTVVVFIVPLILLMVLVTSENVGIYFAVFGLIYFASLGFVCANVIAVKKEVVKTVSEIKVQNAAIAYRLSKNKNEVSEILGNDTAVEYETVTDGEKKDYSKVNLNPEVPIEAQMKKKQNSVEDNFDDFK